MSTTLATPDAKSSVSTGQCRELRRDDLEGVAALFNVGTTPPEYSPCLVTKAVSTQCAPMISYDEDADNWTGATRLVETFVFWPSLYEF